MELLDSLSVDIARMIDHDAAAELWERYKRGERNVFTRRLYTMQGQQTFEEIRKRYRADREFRQTVDRYIGEFERLLEEVSQGERGPGDRAQLSHLRHRQGLHHAGARRRAVRGQRLIAMRRTASSEGRTIGARLSLLAIRCFWHRGAYALTLTVRTERWPIAGAFTIARGAKTEAEVVIAELTDGAAAGPRRVRALCALWRDRRGRRGRARGDARSVCGRGLEPAGACRPRCRPGAARNALDCAFWDLEAKSERPAGPRARRAGGAGTATTAYTISLGTPDAMARGGRQGGGAQAPEGEARRRRRSGAHPRGARGRAERRADRRRQRGLARRQPRGQSRGLRGSRRHAGRAAAAGRRRRGARRDRAADPGVRRRERARPRVAAALVGKYDAVNIKLDKTGGLTEALAMARGGRAARLRPDGRLHGGDVAVDGAGRCWWRNARAWSISTGRCCSRATGRTGCATRRACVHPATAGALGLATPVRRQRRAPAARNAAPAPPIAAIAA